MVNSLLAPKVRPDVLESSEQERYHKYPGEHPASTRLGLGLGEGGELPEELGAVTICDFEQTSFRRVPEEASCDPPGPVMARTFVPSRAVPAVHSRSTHQALCWMHTH